MSVQIFVEGGGKGRDTRPRCREGFTAYFQKIVPERHLPRIIVCGSRDDAFSRFDAAVAMCGANEICVLLVDSEGPVTAADEVAHLSAREPWVFPKLTRHRGFLMVQAMEAWFLADREALARFYGNGFLAKSLPGRATDIEAIPKRDLEPSLQHAAAPTSKGEYHKVRHGFALLALIDPQKVENSSRHAARLHEFLRKS